MFAWLVSWFYFRQVWYSPPYTHSAQCYLQITKIFFQYTPRTCHISVYLSANIMIYGEQVYPHSSVPYFNDKAPSRIIKCVPNRLIVFNLLLDPL